MTTFVEASAPAEKDLPENPESIEVPAETGSIKTHVAQVERAYAEQLASGAITEAQLSKLTWLLTVGKNEHLNLTQLSKRIGYDSETTLHRVFSGKYEARLERVLERIDDYKKLWEQRLGVSKSSFVETSLARQIFETCDLARTYQVILPIYGDSQLGKTFALLEYRRRNNHGRTIYVRMPAKGNLTKFLIALCVALGVNATGNSVALAQRAVGALNENMLLIIDEIHQTCLSDRGSIRLGTIEFIRLELYEAVKCGVVLCGTNVFRDEVDKGRHQAVLEQTKRRGMAILQLPALLPRVDMDAIAASFGLPPAPQDIHAIRVDIIRRYGLMAYSNYLRAGAKLAFNRGKSPDWNHFVSAHDALSKLSKQEAS